VKKTTPEAALPASLAQLGAACDEHQARFARCCEALGAEIGRRQRAEQQRDELLAACECEDAWEAYARGDGPKSAMTAVLARHGWDGFEPTTKFLERIRRAAIAKATGS
jgi:hypothetical protein